MAIKKLNISRPSGKQLIIASIIAILLMCVCGSLYYYLHRPIIDLKGEKSAILYIPTAANFDDVCQLLELDGWLTDKSQFIFMSQLKHYPAHVKAGRFKISDGMSAVGLINMLRSGNQAPVNVTFNNLRTISQLAGVASRSLESDSAELMLAMTDTSLIGSYGFNNATLPAMFIPNTYQFMWNTDGKQWLERMNQEYKRFWTAERIYKADSLELSPVEVSIIASIIEEETNKVDELPIIAGIYLNRLRMGMPLQACPTLKFALGNFALRRILKKDQEVESPYNTYKYAGLPPGPIRIPSITAIDAVLNATDHEYLFMCARPDGSGRHNFARTNAEHARNAAIYQQELNKRKIYR